LIDSIKKELDRLAKDKYSGITEIMMYGNIWKVGEDFNEQLKRFLRGSSGITEAKPGDSGVTPEPSASKSSDM
jgi:hypothetical protein